MRTSASSAPGTQGSPPRVGWPARVGRSSSWRRVIASGVASGHTICPTAPPSIAEARFSLRDTTRSTGSRRRWASPRTRRGRARSEARTPGRVTVGVHRDGLVEGKMDARLFHGAFPAGDPHALRAPAPGSVRAHSLGRDRDGDRLARGDRRRRTVGRAGGRRDPRSLLKEQILRKYGFAWGHAASLVRVTV